MIPLRVFLLSSVKHMFVAVNIYLLVLNILESVFVKHMFVAQVSLRVFLYDAGADWNFTQHCINGEEDQKYDAGADWNLCCLW